MNCTEIREQFSDVVDERLTPAERAALDAHLDGCAACRTELERFRAAVSLVRGLEPVRAPAGFAGRVIAAARPPAVAAHRPWWRRLTDRVLFPLPVKLPVEAAAILLVGVGVVYLFQRTPELQHAARVETPVLVERPVAPPESIAPTTPAPPVTSSTPPVTSVPPVTSPAPPVAGQGKGKQEMFAERPDPTPAPVDKADAVTKKEQRQDVTPRARVDEPPPTGAPPAVVTSPRPAESRAPIASQAAPVEPRRILRDAREKDQQREEPRAQEILPPPPARPPATAAPSSGVTQRLAMKAAMAHVSGALTVASRASAEPALRELTARHRGQVVASRADAATTIVDVRVPRDEYAAFVAALADLGRWRADREPSELPADVGITLRLTE